MNKWSVCMHEKIISHWKCKLNNHEIWLIVNPMSKMKVTETPNVLDNGEQVQSPGRAGGNLGVVHLLSKPDEQLLPYLNMCFTGDLVILSVDSYLKARETHTVTKTYASIFPEVSLVIIKTCKQRRCFFQEKINTLCSDIWENATIQQ